MSIDCHDSTIDEECFYSTRTEYKNYATENCGILYVQDYSTRVNEMRNNKAGWTLFAKFRACYLKGHIKSKFGKNYCLKALNAHFIDLHGASRASDELNRALESLICGDRAIGSEGPDESIAQRARDAEWVRANNEWHRC